MPLFTARAGASRRHDGNAALPVCLLASGRVAVFPTGRFGLTFARVCAAHPLPQPPARAPQGAACPVESATAVFSHPSRLNTAVRIEFTTTAGQDARRRCSPGSCPLRPQRGADRGAGFNSGGGHCHRIGRAAPIAARSEFTTAAGQDAGQWCSPGSCPLRPQRGAGRGAGSCPGCRQPLACRSPRASAACGHSSTTHEE